MTAATDNPPATERARRKTSTRVRTVPRPTDLTWFSPKEAAAYVGIGIDSIYDACASRGLRSVKLGHSTVRIHREWLDDWMISQTEQHA